MIFLFIPLGIFLLDFYVKRYIDRHKALDEKEEICGKKLILTKYYNKGAAFNFLAGRPKLVRVIHGVVIAAAAAGYLLVLRKKGNSGLKVSLGMLIGGGLSNFIDRCTRGHVVDYCSFNVKNKKVRGIVFNISDFFVFFGAVSATFFGSSK